MAKKKHEPAVTEHTPLLTRLGENLETTGEYGWEEDTDDRTVEVDGDTLTVKCTFEHDDDRGGRQRVATDFTVEDGKLQSDNGDECDLGDEKKLQEFVNECCSYHEG